MDNIQENFNSRINLKAVFMVHFKERSGHLLGTTYENHEKLRGDQSSNSINMIVIT